MKTTIRSYRDLEVWQKSMDLVEAVYKVTQKFPRDEQFQLTSQIRRAAVAVPSNIAEGHGRTGSNEYAHFLSIAHGSLCELETQLLIAERLNYMPTEARNKLLEQAASIGQMLKALMNRLRRNQNQHGPRGA